jgi:putative endonuclease
MAQHNEVGREGEMAAASYLRTNGYTIRHTNWTFGKLELDIVAEKDGWLVVVEVKTRSTETFEHPEDAITNKKIRRIVTAADAYIRSYDIGLPVRFDVIAAIPKGNGYRIDHIDDAFMAPVNY